MAVCIPAGVRLLRQYSCMVGDGSRLWASRKRIRCGSLHPCGRAAVTSILIFPDIGLLGAASTCPARASHLGGPRSRYGCTVLYVGGFTGPQGVEGEIWRPHPPCKQGESLAPVSSRVLWRRTRLRLALACCAIEFAQLQLSMHRSRRAKGPQVHMIVHLGRAELAQP